APGAVARPRSLEELRRARRCPRRHVPRRGAQVILPRYVTAIARIDADRVVSILARRHLRLPLSGTLLRRLREARLGQADLLLALLHLRHPCRAALHWVAVLIGRPVMRCPTQYLRWPVNGVPRVRTPRLYLVATSNPRRDNTPAYDRFAAAFRDG